MSVWLNVLEIGGRLNNVKSGIRKSVAERRNNAGKAMPGSTVYEMQLTQYGHHHIIPEDLDGASRNKVKGSENVTAVDQSVPGRSVGGFEAHGESSQAAFVGSSKGLAVLQQAAVQMQANVSLQTLREAL